MTQKTDKFNVTKDGDQYKATATRYFDSMDEAQGWVDSIEDTDTPELPASEMTEEDAEKINSNVNPAPHHPGADEVKSGAGHNREDEQAQKEKENSSN